MHGAAMHVGWTLCVCKMGEGMHGGAPVVGVVDGTMMRARVGAGTCVSVCTPCCVVSLWVLS